MSEIPDNSATEKPYDFETKIKSKVIVVGTNIKVKVDYEKNKVIVDGRIEPKFIPNIEEEEGYFQLTLLFELK